MSEIYKALRDAERQKSAARDPDAVLSALNGPLSVSVPGTAVSEASLDSGPSLIRSVLERLKAKNSGAGGSAGARGGPGGLTVLTLSGAGNRQGEPTLDRASEDASPPMERVAFDLVRQLAAVENSFAGLAERLSAAVDDLRAGRPPAGDLTAELTACETDFNTLRKQVVELAPAASALAETASSPSATLSDLLTVLQATMEMERRRREFEETRRRATAELEPVLRLAHREGGTFPPLDQCQSQARELLDQVDKAEWPDLPAGCALLVERRHAFSRLLDLVIHSEDLSDQDWEAAEEAVASSFGKPLAVAVSRRHLRLEAGAGQSA